MRLALEPAPGLFCFLSLSLSLLRLRFQYFFRYELRAVQHIVDILVYEPEYCFRIRKADFHLGRMYVDVGFLRWN